MVCNAMSGEMYDLPIGRQEAPRRRVASKQQRSHGIQSRNVGRLPISGVKAGQPWRTRPVTIADSENIPRGEMPQALRGRQQRGKAGRDSNLKLFDEGVAIRIGQDAER